MMNPLGSLNNFVFNENSINTDSQNTVKKPDLEIKDSHDSNISSKQSIEKRRDPETDYSKNNFEDELQNEEENLQPKDYKKPNSFKNKLEDLNSAIDLLLMGMQPAPVMQANPETETASIDLSLNFNTDTTNATILANLGDKLADRSESLIKDIANIDLGSEGAIQDILKLSDTLEQINALEAKLAELTKQLNLQTVEPDTNSSEPELNLLLDDKLEKFIDKYLDNTTGINKSEEASSHSITDDGSIEVLQGAKAEENFNDTQDQDANSANHDNDRFMLNELSSKTKSSDSVDNNTTVIKETVNVNKLTKFLTDRIVKIDSGKREEILMKLTPGDMGEVKLSIARQGDKLEIKMEFSSQESLDTVEHRLNELQTSLRAKGFDTEIKVSTTESTNSNSNQQQQHNSSNEARDEQKEKYLHSMPSWLRDKESHIKTSFQEALGGILK